MRRCPKCNRELVEVKAGDLYRNSAGAQVYAHQGQLVCVGCKKAPAYCDCPVLIALDSEEEFEFINPDREEGAYFP